MLRAHLMNGFVFDAVENQNSKTNVVACQISKGLHLNKCALVYIGFDF